MNRLFSLLMHLKYLVVVCVLVTFSTSASALYKYEYYGNTFISTASSPQFPNQDLHSVSALGIAVYTENPLAPGSSLTDVLYFSISHVDEFYGNNLFYPLPQYDPMAWPGSPGNPFNIPTFSIGSVDNSGLPSSWDISLDYSFRSPTAREFKRLFESSETSDSIFGYYEGFSYISGVLTNHPGSWTVSFVSSVPEPNVNALMLFGLGIMALYVRRRRL